MTMPMLRWRRTATPRASSCFLAAAFLFSLTLTPSSALGGSLISPKQSPSSSHAESASSTFDRIWERAVLYDDPSNSFLQKLTFKGRFQFQYDYLRSDLGDVDEWLIRRWRMGLKASVFEDFILHSEVDLNPQESEFYRRLTEAYIGWTPSDQFTLKVGKQSAPFTLDGHTSSNNLLTIERNVLTDKLWFPQEYMPGVTAAQRTDRWSLFGGIYSAGSRSKEFGNFDGSAFLLASIARSWAQELDVNEALLTLDYVFQNPNENNTFTRPFRHVASLNFRYEERSWGARTDLSGGKGYGTQNDLWGVVAMPYWNLTKRWQLVGRYTFLKGDDFSLSADPESLADILVGEGGRYNEIYAGLNWFLYGQKLKWQTGVTYGRINNSRLNRSFDAWGVSTGIRVSW